MSEISLVLQGLNCPNCAGKIEKNVSKMKHVSDASLNLMKQEIFIEYMDKDVTREEIINEVRKITVALEPHVVVSEKKGQTKNSVLEHIHQGGCKNGQGQDNAHATHHTILHTDEDCSCGYTHEQKIEKEIVAEKKAKGFLVSKLNDKMKKRLLLYALGVALYIAAITEVFGSTGSLGLFLISYGLFGWDVIYKAIKNLMHGEVFDENFLMSVSTIGAFAIGQYPEAIAVMLFYQAGEFFQDMAVDSSRSSIQSLMDLKSDHANLVTENGIVSVDPEDIQIDQIILVKPGEKVPLDGVVIEGKSQIDASSLIGESVPRSVEESETVMSGSLNLTGALKVKVSKDYENSTVAKIMDMVENATNKKAPTERFITKFAKIYTPLVVLAAALLAIVPPLVIEGALFSDWLYRGLVFLVVSCPCALVISVPLSFFSGIGFASRNGILVKGSVYLQNLSDVNTVVFDKTGTLTKGVFKVTEIQTAQGVLEKDLIGIAGAIETMSNHPIAKSILNEYRSQFGDTVTLPVAEFEEIGGKGLKGFIHGNRILAGNDKLLQMHGVSYTPYEGFGTVVYIARDEQYMGFIVISDIIKEDSQSAIEKLKSMGIKKVVMLTGDRKESAEKIAQSIGIDEVYYELLPNEKVEAIEKIYQNNSQAKIAFAGDGINDAPVLARVDVGIAMGGVGSDAAIEAADIVLMTDEPSKICSAIFTANKTMAIVKQNITFALLVKFCVLLLSAFGYASMWLAVFADVGVALLAVLNAMRAK